MSRLLQPWIEVSNSNSKTRWCPSLFRLRHFNKSNYFCILLEIRNLPYRQHDDAANILQLEPQEQGKTKKSRLFVCLLELLCRHVPLTMPYTIVVEEACRNRSKTSEIPEGLTKYLNWRLTRERFWETASRRETQKGISIDNNSSSLAELFIKSPPHLRGLKEMNDVLYLWYRGLTSISMYLP